MAPSQAPTLRVTSSAQGCGRRTIHRLGDGVRIGLFARQQQAAANEILNFTIAKLEPIAAKAEWEAALAFFRKLGLREAAKAWPIARLSTGERLRLALVRALMVRPRVLLLDEPTAALDAASVASVESLIKTRMQSGLAVLWVTHDTEQAKRVAHRLLVVDAGQVEERAPEWIATSP